MEEIEINMQKTMIIKQRNEKFINVGLSNICHTLLINI